MRGEVGFRGSKYTQASPEPWRKTMDSSYRQEPLDGGRVRFTVSPAPVPKASGAPAVLAALFVLIVLGTMTRDTNAFWLLVRLAAAVFGARWIYRATNQWFA